MRLSAPDSSRLTATVALVALWLLAVPGAATAVADSPAKPTVLLFHGGGFLLYDTRGEAPNVAYYRSRGFRAVAVKYPLGDLPAAHRVAVATARRYRRHGPVVAAGTSSGGGIAAYLAATGRVDAAVGVCALTDYVSWMPGRWRHFVRASKTATRARYSTSYGSRPVKSPLHLYHSPLDTQVPYATARRLSARRNVTLITLGVDHCEDRSWETTAASFLRRQIQRQRPNTLLRQPW